MKQCYALYSLILALLLTTGLLSGCGGGSGSEAVSTTRLAPTAKTVAAVDNLLGGYGQARVTSDIQSKGQATRAIQKTRAEGSSTSPPANFDSTYDPTYELYFTLDNTPTSVKYSYFEDANLTLSAGESTQSYSLLNDVFTFITSFSFTKGPFAGLTGSTSVFKSDTKSNYDSDITTPNVGKTISTFRGTVGASGIVGTGSNTFTSVSGYRSEATLTYKDDGTKQYTTRDSNNYASSFNFAVDASGQGTITGTDPGLPATATWDTKGTGVVTWADGSKTNFIQWDIPTSLS